MSVKYLSQKYSNVKTCCRLFSNIQNIIIDFESYAKIKLPALRAHFGKASSGPRAGGTKRRFFGLSARRGQFFFIELKIDRAVRILGR